LTDLGTDGKIILQHFLKKKGTRMCTQFIWLRTGSNGRLL
jgi:hypothetical protein